MPRNREAKPWRPAPQAKTARRRSAAARETTKRAPRESEDDATSGPFWSGTITFGLVSVPVNLYPAHRQDQVPLRMLGPNGSPVARRYYCEQDGREVGGDHLVRGFEIEPGKHVVVTEEELERLAPRKTRDIELKRFVDASKLDPVRFDRPYFLTPGTESTKAYRLLAGVMERTNRAGIATFVMHGKERIVAILAEGGILRAETLRFSDEIRTPKEIGLPERSEVDRGKVGAFAKAIAAKAKPGLSAEELADPHVDAMRRLVEKKRRSGKRVVARAAEGDEPIDLVEVLKRSLSREATPRRASSRARA
ncbi:MAG TPA: Ku protein [Candidatus Polarisedimenticolaceae bacterium]|nr:Ku protein [Candidatus Polarisedimenticolaceae bacterium]